MFGPSRGVTLGFAGWLWADLLLGLFAIFALATTVGVGPAARAARLAPSSTVAPAIATPLVVSTAAPASVPRPPGVDPAPVEIPLAVNGVALLSGDARAVEAEQRRIAADVTQRVTGRRVALVLAYGSHGDPRTGDRLAEIATAGLTGGPFDGAAIKAFHNLVPGDRGSRVDLSIYLYQ